MSINKEIAWLLAEKYGGMESDAFRADCKRLEAGEPLGYVIGQVPFLGCEIWLDSRPLIPRLETEYWVEQAIATIATRIKGSPLSGDQGEPFARVLDLCAGSGAIGVAVAKSLPTVDVVFAEIDPTHLPTIEKNLMQNLTASSLRAKNSEDKSLSVNRKALRERFLVVESDLFINIPGVFDFILTNPPYIDKNKHTIDKSVKEYEPHLALFGGELGMAVIEKIIIEARAKLAPLTTNNSHGGQLWIEHEPFQVDAIVTLAKANHYTCTTHLDQYNVPRYSVLTVA